MSKNIHPMTEHPAAGTVVKIVYNGASEYYAKWDGEQWLTRVPYTSGDGEWEPAPFDLVFDWYELEQQPKFYEK